jgi:hypothetical protein
VSLHIADAGSRHLCFLSDATVRFVAVAISAPTALMAVTIAAAGRSEFAGFPGAFESEITISWHPEFYYYCFIFQLKHSREHIFVVIRIQNIIITCIGSYVDVLESFLFGQV